MTFGTLTYLLGFLAVTIPIVIHLWSKKTRKTIPFGTVRFLREDDAQAIKSLIPTEWLLLLLRMMMLVLLVLIMSEPLWKNDQSEARMVLIDPVYQQHPDFEKIKDSIQAQADTRWFSRGFPDINDSLTLSKISHWALLEALEQKIAEQITVISPRRIQDFIGPRPQQMRVNWVSLPEEVKSFEVGHFTSEKGIIKIEANSTDTHTHFTHVADNHSLPDTLVVPVAVESDDTYAKLAKFIQASLETINETGPLKVEIVAVADAEWLIWLKEEPAPKRRKLLYSTVAVDRQLLQRVSKDIFAISAFQLEDFLANDFPVRLEQILGAGKVDLSPYDWRTLSESQLLASENHTSPSTLTKAQDISKWFWGALLLILLLERFLSLKNKAIG